MNLYEYEGKQLFKAYKIPIAEGWLADNVPANLTKPVVAKAQVLSGGRGKQGGIRPVNNPNNLQQVIHTLKHLPIHNELPVDVYVEENVSYQKELYISIIIDRDLKLPMLIASTEGGVDIEETPSEKIIRFPIHPYIGVRRFMIQRLAQFWGVAQEEVRLLLFRMWELFLSEQAELVEINPLFKTKEQTLIAGDAKITLDNEGTTLDSIKLLPRNDHHFEARIDKVGAVGVEMDGNIAIVTSGAGLGLATLDLVRSVNETACALIDLGGHIIYDLPSLKQLIIELKALKPKKFLFNFYFQVASCKTIADAIAEELGNKPYSVFVRMKGIGEQKARETLANYHNIYITDSLVDVTNQIAVEVS